MKKLLKNVRKVVLIITLLFISISCRTDNSAKPDKVIIDPPSWIIGKWKITNGSDYTYTFMKGDILIHAAGMPINVKPIADVGQYAQTSSDENFTFTLHPNGLTQTFRFRKISSTKIVSDLGLYDGLLYEFTKQ